MKTILKYIILIILEAIVIITLDILPTPQTIIYNQAISTYQQANKIICIILAIIFVIMDITSFVKTLRLRKKMKINEL